MTFLQNRDRTMVSSTASAMSYQKSNGHVRQPSLGMVVLDEKAAGFKGTANNSNGGAADGLAIPTASVVNSACGTRREQMVYFVRHAEALHNIKEREAVQRAIACGILEKAEQERLRRAVLEDASFLDAPLSDDGLSQVRDVATALQLLNRVGLSKYPAPRVVLVSPLRRALMTATQLFYDAAAPPQRRPRFVAVEAIREKRTGYAADERSGVDVLEREFPHVDFSDIRRSEAAGGDGGSPIRVGEDNDALRKRAKEFLEGPFAEMTRHCHAVAIVTHKGWLREQRKVLKRWSEEDRVDGRTQRLRVDFDLDCWDQTLYKNAEIRIAQMGWEKIETAAAPDAPAAPGKEQLVSLVSRSVESAFVEIIQDPAATGTLRKTLSADNFSVMKKTLSQDNLSLLSGFVVGGNSDHSSDPKPYVHPDTISELDMTAVTISDDDDEYDDFANAAEEEGICF